MNQTQTQNKWTDWKISQFSFTLLNAIQKSLLFAKAAFIWSEIQQKEWNIIRI